MSKTPHPVSFAVFEREPKVVYSEIRAWVALFTFFCNGVPYEYYFVIGMPGLTERQAHDIMSNRRHVDDARRLFLDEVVVAPTIH